MKAISKEFSEISDFGGALGSERLSLSVYFYYYKNTPVFEWNLVPKFKSNRERTFEVLRFWEAPGARRTLSVYTFFIIIKTLLHSNGTLFPNLKSIGKELLDFLDFRGLKGARGPLFFKTVLLKYF